MNHLNQLSRTEMSNVLGGVAEAGKVWMCSATNSQGNPVSYITDDQTSAQLWYNFWYAAGDSPSCVLTQTYDS